MIIYARTDDPDVYSISEHMFSFGPVIGSPPPVIISPSIIDYCIVHVSRRHHFPKRHCDSSQPSLPPVRASRSLRLLCIVSIHTVFHCYPPSPLSGLIGRALTSWPAGVCVGQGTCTRWAICDISYCSVLRESTIRILCHL